MKLTKEEADDIARRFHVELNRAARSKVSYISVFTFPDKVVAFRVAVGKDGDACFAWLKESAT